MPRDGDHILAATRRTKTSSSQFPAAASVIIVLFGLFT